MKTMKTEASRTPMKLGSAANRDLSLCWEARLVIQTRPPETNISRILGLKYNGQSESSANSPLVSYS